LGLNTVTSSRKRKYAKIIARDPVRAAEEASLNYVSDDSPGIKRLRVGNAFRYQNANGKKITRATELRRIEALAIPPAWEQVWICPSPTGHLQATGRDARGRKQYLYHAEWRQVRDAAKFDRMEFFAKVLPAVRRRVAQDLRRPGLPREKVLALILRLLEVTLIRVGSEEYATSNGTYGLTTLKNRHASLNGKTACFLFRGKSGVRHEIGFQDARLVKLVRQCQDLPGQRLFEYRDDSGDIRTVTSSDVNAYLREITGEDITSKDFRTWFGTVIAIQELLAAAPASTKSETKAAVVTAIKATATRLGNTPAICRKSYIHPAVIETYQAGGLKSAFRGMQSRRSRHWWELAALRFLRKQARSDRPTK
jgi:DNA topoisomerase-1